MEFDKALWSKVKKHAEAEGYSTPEEFVVHVVERELQKDEAPQDPAKLKGIGYIDAGRDI
jgi:hypothetical protein